MTNFYDGIKGSNLFQKFTIDELLFVEYTCEPGGPKTRIWSHNNYFTFVVNGSMILKTHEKDFPLQAGSAYFVKKGGFTVPQFFDEIFCDLIIFFPDEFIREVIHKYRIGPATGSRTFTSEPVIPLNMDEVLTSYYHSLLAYFSKRKPPPEPLLRIKLEELIVNILTTTTNPALRQYFHSLQLKSKPSIRETMEANFNSAISLADFARLCARSLSSFRRDFVRLYNMPPGRWLREKRLDYSRHLIETTDRGMEDILYEAGFRNRSHFIRVFKERFGHPPNQFRKSIR